MEARSSALITAVSLLVPPACREHVTGDLCERYTSHRQFLGDAAATLPLILFSQIRRTSSASLIVVEATALACSFLSAAALFGNSPFSFGTVPWLRLGAPCATALLTIVLRDAYTGHTLRPPVARAFDAFPALTIAVAFEAALSLPGSRLALPPLIAMAGSGLSVLTLLATRLLFAPLQHSMRSAWTPWSDHRVGGGAMMISEQERERLRAEERVREELRQEHRRQRRPRLLAIAAAWTLILTALAFFSTHFRG